MGNNRDFKFLTVILFVFLAYSSFLLSGQNVFAQTDQTTSKLQEANKAVDQAFSAVLDAEKAGANVTGQLTQLNIAQEDLAQAENSYRTGDLSTVYVQADTALRLTNQVIVSAQNAKQTALVSSQNVFCQKIALIATVASIFVLVLSLVWRWFKSRYINNLSETKPEVVNY